MTGLLFYFSFILIGYGLQSSGWLPVRTTKILAQLSIGIFSPSLVFVSLTSQYNKTTLLEELYLPVGSFAIAGLSAVCGLLAQRCFRSRCDDAESATLGFAFALGNYAFLPLAISTSIWGSKAASQLILSTLGSDLAIWTIGISFFPVRGSRLKRLINPPLGALLAALVVLLINSTSLTLAASYLNELLQVFSLAALPASMTLIGMHLAKAGAIPWRDFRIAVLVVFRTVVLPSLILILVFSWSIDPGTYRVLILLSMMPTAIATVMLSELYGGSPKFAAHCIAATHMAAAIAVPIWLWNLNLLF